jgi:hypothetical protein
MTTMLEGRRWEADLASPPRPRPFRRLIFAVLAILLAFLMSGLALLVPAGTRLVEARSQLERGRSYLLRGDPEEALRAFSGATERARSAHRWASNPVSRAVAMIPVVGRTARMAAGLAEGARGVGRAGEAIAVSVEELQGGLSGLVPQDGAVSPEAFGPVGRALTEARSLLDEAAAAVERTPQGAVLPPLSGAVETFRSGLSDLRRSVLVSEELFMALPSFLGQGGARRYFVGAQNPAELRGTGGLIGAFAILTIEDGRFELGGFQDIEELPDVPPGELPPPNEDFAERYDRFGGAGFWKNINMTPDFPSAAIAIERLHAHVTGVELDGTILADPWALASLMEVTGPASVPGTERTVDADDLVPFVSNTAYGILTDPDERKRLLGDLAGQVLDGYFSQAAGGNPRAAARSLAEAASEGHLLLHAADGEVQEAFERAGVSGALLAPPGDYLAVAVTNAGGNKVDFYADRTIRYQVQLLPRGSAEGTLEMTFENDAPDAGPPRYVIGPQPGASEAGENVMLVNAFCATTCDLRSTGQSAGGETVGVEEELGHPVVWNGLRLRSGERDTLTHSWTVDDVWGLDDRGASRYQLLVQEPPTIRPTSLRVEVRPPPGMRVTGGAPGVRIEEGMAVWEGDPAWETRLWVDLEARLSMLRR